jgi:regulator of nucleoside diphosphate kinase
MMKPVLSVEDFRLLQNLVKTHGHSERKMLGEEIMKAQVVEDHELKAGTVKMNSEVEVLDMSTGRKISFKLVLPDIADVKTRRISVFAPLSVAMLGYRENDTVTWRLPEGETKFRILRVKND